MRGRLPLAVAVLGCAACVSRTVTPRGTEAAATPDEVQTIARLALTLDAAGDRAADTLYAPDAVVVLARRFAAS